MGDERSRGAHPGAHAADERAGQCAGTRLAASGDGEPFGLLDRGTGAALRPEQDLGGEPPGVGGDPARVGAATGARGKTRRIAGPALPGAGGAQQPGALPAHGCRVRRTTVDHAASRRVLSSLAQRQRRRARADPGRAQVIRQDASATEHAGPETEPDHGDRATGAGASGIAAPEPRRPTAQDRRRHRVADRTSTTNRGARTKPC